MTNSVLSGSSHMLHSIRCEVQAQGTRRYSKAGSSSRAVTVTIRQGLSQPGGKRRSYPTPGKLSHPNCTMVLEQVGTAWLSWALCSAVWHSA